MSGSLFSSLIDAFPSARSLEKININLSNKILINLCARSFENNQNQFNQNKINFFDSRLSILPLKKLSKILPLTPSL